MHRLIALLVTALATGAPALAAQRAGAPAAREVYVDEAGVIRWRDDRREVALFGANYVLPTASDYRAAGYLRADRRRMIDEDMAQFARMGWDGLRLTFWGDWEASDSAGNLIANDHLDLLDWLIARARERGIYLLFSPIQLYNAKWPDALADTSAPGFGRRYSRERMGVDPAAIAAQTNYLRQILRHGTRTPARRSRTSRPSCSSSWSTSRSTTSRTSPARSATSTRSPRRCGPPAAASWCSTT